MLQILVGGAFENFSEDSNSEFTSFTIPKSIIYINSNAFNGCNKLTKINYIGTEEEWNQIDGNTCLTNVTKVYNYIGE